MSNLSIEDRVERLEALAHEPFDITKTIVLVAETVARTIESDPHVFSTRPCQTCKAVSGLVGRAFGCVAASQAHFGLRGGAPR